MEFDPRIYRISVGFTFDVVVFWLSLERIHFKNVAGQKA